MDERLAKHILAHTCQMVDPRDPGWQVNAANIAFNTSYGFGLVDADKLTTLLGACTGVSAQEIETTGAVVNMAIPDGNLTGFSIPFQLTGTTPLEEVEVYLDIEHSWRGDIEAILTSPQGTTSQLMINNPADSWDDIDWTFVTNAFWGEVPQGQWELNVRDVYSWDSGTLIEYGILAKSGWLHPEPTTMVLLVGGLGLLAARRRRSKAA